MPTFTLEVPGGSALVLPDFIAEAIPFFLIAIAIELLVSFSKREKYYRFNDTFSSMATGIMDFSMSFIYKRALGLTMYAYINHHYGSSYCKQLEADGSIALSVFTFLAVDFLYYSLHRWTHECHLGWATHVVHHSSEEYNLSTALRQGMFQGLFGAMFYYPLAFIVPTRLYAIHSQANTLYQFWIHTKAVPKLGFLEYILNTPSAHRVHHGRNPKYIDKNYAGILIIWDRLLGTFQEELEEDEVIYGLVHPLEYFNPIITELHVWRDMLVAAWHSGRQYGVWYAVQVIVRGPGWNPDETAKKGELAYYDIPDPPTSDKLVKVHTIIPGAFTGYGFAQFLIVLPVVALLAEDKQLSMMYVLPRLGYIWWLLINVGFIYDGMLSLGAFSEMLRQVITLIALSPSLTSLSPMIAESVQPYAPMLSVVAERLLPNSLLKLPIGSLTGATLFATACAASLTALVAVAASTLLIGRATVRKLKQE